MSRTTKWMIGIVVLGAIAGLGTWAFVEGRKELAVERERDAPVKAPSRTSRTADGQTVITLDHETQDRIALKVEPLEALTLASQTIAYGTLQEDPSQTLTLRAPIPGTLRAQAEHKWPSIGDVLADGDMVGMIEPRFAPVDRVDLASKLAVAKADVEATTALLAAARASFERLRALNAQESNSVSQRVLQDAEANVKSEEARLSAATETVKLIESATTAKSGPAGPTPLTVERGGQIIVLSANAGESVESGQTILKVARFQKLLAAVSILPGHSLDSSATTARIVVLGHEDHPLTAERAAIVPTVDAKTLAQTFLFRVNDENFGLRPGMAVTAYLSTPTVPRPGVNVPRSAVVRWNGRGWAYLQTANDKFTRQEVSTDEPTPDGWFNASGWKSGSHVVVAGAQMLLSEELKSQIQIGEEGEGQ